MDLTNKDDIRPVLAAFIGDTDRACGILAGAFLEELLEELVRRHMVESLPEDLFAKYGPLSSFAGKIDLAFALDLLSTSEFTDLHRIRRIRNIFAHSLEVLRFDSSPVRDHVDQLLLRRSTITGLATQKRSDFETSALILVGFLQSRIKQAVRPIVPHDVSDKLREHRTHDPTRAPGKREASNESGESSA